MSLPFPYSSRTEHTTLEPFALLMCRGKLQAYENITAMRRSYTRISFLPIWEGIVAQTPFVATLAANMYLTQ
jgi:hypothetical protein